MWQPGSFCEKTQTKQIDLINELLVLSYEAAVAQEVESVSDLVTRSVFVQVTEPQLAPCGCSSVYE